jgi:hypothetical protein
MQPSKLSVVFHAMQASTAMKRVKALSLHVKIVQQESTHRLKVFQVVMVAMIAHLANTQKKQEIWIHPNVTPVFQDFPKTWLATPHALLVQWVGRRKLEVPSVNRAALVHTVMWKVKNVKIVMLGSIVEMKTRPIHALTVLLDTLHQPMGNHFVWDVMLAST